MPAWVAILTAVMPHLTQIVSAAVPVFTHGAHSSERLMAQQIKELQEAVRTNADSIKTVAEQVQRIVQAIDEATVSNRKALRRVHVVAVMSLIAALVALGFAVAAILLR